MKIDKELKEQLDEIQDLALNHAYDEMVETKNYSDLTSKYDIKMRGDLTKLAAQSLGVAARLEQFMAFRERPAQYDVETSQVDEEARQREYVRKAEAKIEAIIARSRVLN